MTFKQWVGDKITDLAYDSIQKRVQGQGGKMPKKKMEHEKFLLQEKYLWFLGQEDLLADFYQNRVSTYSLIDTRASYFYANVTNAIRTVHSSVPAMISYGKAELLMSGGLEKVVTINDEESEEATATLEEIYKENTEETNLMVDSVATESWGGKFAWKLCKDEEVSEYPIIQMYTPLEYEAIYKYGRLQELIFPQDYNYDNVDYILEEIYGKGYIDYVLYQKGKNGNFEVPLDTIPETAELERQEFPTDMIFASEKRAIKSDYNGIISEFDGLDESWSQMVEENRTAKVEIYYPEKLLIGNKTPDDFRKRYVKTASDEGENAKNEIKHIQPDMRPEKYNTTQATFLNNILASVRLNPITIGINDDIGANASGDAREKAEVVSMRTRKSMIDGYESFLNSFDEKILVANDLFNGNKPQEYVVANTFGSYTTPSMETVVANVKLLREQDVIDIEKGIDMVFGDSVTEEEKNRILANSGELTLDDNIE